MAFDYAFGDLYTRADGSRYMASGHAFCVCVSAGRLMPVYTRADAQEYGSRCMA